MPRATSLDLRWRIVAWKYEDNWTLDQIANAARVSRRTVINILAIHRKHGQPTRPPSSLRSPGRPRLLENTDMRYLSSLLAARPTLFIDEIQRRLEETCNLHVSLLTVYRSLQRLAISHKHVSREALERDEELRAIWKGVVGREVDPNVFVWCDESSINNRVVQRNWGWSSIGQACITHELFRRGERLSILPAFSTDGVVAVGIFDGSVTKDRFLYFLREHLAPQLNRYPGPRSIVVMDNCRIHHD